MGVYDHTARPAAKREPAGFFRWLLPRLDPALAFAGWLDTRTAPSPPESELTCDILAEFLARERPEEPWVFVIEFQTEPRGDDVERALEYALRFRRERRPMWDTRLKYLVGGVLLNLTGPPQTDALSMSLPGLMEFGLTGRVVRLAVREEDAMATLARVASGELSRCVLPWVALMGGSGEAATIEEWKRLADLVDFPRNGGHGVKSVNSLQEVHLCPERDAPTPPSSRSRRSSSSPSKATPWPRPPAPSASART